MLYYYRIDVSEGIDVNKTSASKECDVSDFWYLNYSFKFQPNVCNRYHDLLMISLILSFGNTEIEKKKFYCHNTPIFFGDVDIEKVLVSKKIYFGEKNYKVNHKVKPLR